MKGDAKPPKYKKNQAIRQAAQVARIIYRAQPNRMFLLGSVILGPLMCVFDYDRSGAVVTNCVHMDDDPKWFLRVLLGFAYANSAEMGTDPTVKLDSNMKTGQIKVGNKWYPIKDVLHVEGVIRGRGTVVYRVSNPDDDGDWTEGIVKGLLVGHLSG